MTCVPKNVTLDVNVSIEDIYNNKIKKLTYSRVCATMNRQATSVFLELIDFKESYVIEGFGDYNVWTGRYSDLVIKANIDYTGFEHVRLEHILNQHDLCATIKVNMYEYFYGATRDLVFFNDSRVFITDHVPCDHGTTLVKGGLGLMNPDDMQRGDLYIFIEADMSLYDREAMDYHREELKTIFTII